MGFCTEEEHKVFLQQVPQFERLLIGEGISLTKFWFSVTPGEQHTRFAIRQIDPVRQWKLSPTDIARGNWNPVSGGPPRRSGHQGSPSRADCSCRWRRRYPAGMHTL